MKIIFFGSSKYSVIVAEKIFHAIGLSAIVTIPDKPIGRKHILTPIPVKTFAEQNNIPYITTNKLDGQTIDKLKSFDADFFVVADYGLIIPQTILDLPKKASLNVHHSLLPKYRGPTPAPSAILAGEKISGVSIIVMSSKVDAGDIVTQKNYELKPDETTPSLLTKLNTLGGDIIIDVLKNFENYKPIPQDESKATYTPRLTKESGYIDLEKQNMPNLKFKIENWKLKIERAVRALYPWPGVWLKFKIKNSKLRIKLLPSPCHPNPELVEGEGSSSLNNAVLIQIEGKNPMTIKDFINGYPEGKELAEKLHLLSF